MPLTPRGSERVLRIIDSMAVAPCSADQLANLTHDLRLGVPPPKKSPPTAIRTIRPGLSAKIV
jgi:hypothetical protein